MLVALLNFRGSFAASLGTFLDVFVAAGAADRGRLRQRQRRRRLLRRKRLERRRRFRRRELRLGNGKPSQVRSMVFMELVATYSSCILFLWTLLFIPEHFSGLTTISSYSLILFLIWVC